MKLLMENFRQFILEEEIEDFAKDKETLTEEELRAFIKELCRKKNIHMTEEQLDEAMPRWLRKIGATAALGGALMGAGGPAMAADTGPVSNADAPAMQVDADAGAEDSSAVDDFNAALGYIKSYIDSKGSSSEKMNLELQFMNLQKALDKAADGDTSMLDGLSGDDGTLRDFTLEKVSKVKTSKADVYSSWKAIGAGVQINQ